MKKRRIIISYSDVITNSSTEIFLIQGPDALRQMIGTGVYKKYQKDFLILKTEEDVEYFFRYQGKKGFNHNYSIYDLRPLLGNLFNLYFDMINEFPDKEEDIWEMFKSKIIERLKGSIVYIDIKHNQKIMNRLNELFPDDRDYSRNVISLNYLKQKGFRYGWSLD